MSRSTRAYLDHNATAPLRPEAMDAMVTALGRAGNASSVHAEGRAARATVEQARESVASLCGAAPKAVVFTGGGSEANATVLTPSFRRLSDAAGTDVLLMSATEHPCVLEGHRFAPEAVERIPVDRRGLVDLDWLRTRLEALAPRRALVSIHLANNETGVIQPVAQAAAIVHAHGGLIHSDAVQAAGKIPVDIAALGVDALTLSAHKLGGPQGVGALVFASDTYALDRLVRGGGQERGWRAGTENVAGIAGFGAAATVAARDLRAEGERLGELRSLCEAEIRRLAPDAEILGEGAPRLPNTVLFAVAGLKAETALIAFDLAGVAASSGSACSSGKVKRSHVLDAMGVDAHLAQGAIRLSFGWTTTDADVLQFAKACETTLATLSNRKAHAA